MGRGIDYGMGQTNIDKENGIRFGVIPMNDLGEFAWDSFEADYGPACCGKCGNEAVDFNSEAHSEYTRGRGCSDYACEGCEYVFDSSEAFGEEAVGHSLDDGEYKATADSQGDAFIMKSPYFTRAAFCSPCAPGACHLRNPDADGERAYCFGHDWFDGDVAPYPVFSVATGEPVSPGTDAAPDAETDSDPEDDEPQEGDYVTRDRIEWREFGTGRVLIRTPCPSDPHTSADDYGAQLKAHMTAAGFYPNAWLERERGGYDLLDLDTGTFAEYSR
jgi:hypothetical protein